MKFLENLNLEKLSNSLTNRELGGGLIVNGRVEVYSTKRAGDDKKNSKLLTSKITDIVDNSKSGNSGIGDLNFKSTKKLLVDLIQTLNASFVDYDFSELSPDSFAQTTIHEAVQNINSFFAELTISDPNFINNMWKEMSECMGQLMTQCEVYKLSENTILDEEEDECSVWSFNYFFCNKDLKRICYFTCTATSKFRRLQSGVNTSGGAAGLEQDEDAYDNDTSMVLSDGGGEESGEEWD